MKIVICGSMSASKEMMGMKNALEEVGHFVVVPKNTDKYALGEFTPEDRRESTQNKIDHDLIREYFRLIEENDVVIVANYDKRGVKNYIGGNSFLEAAFAHVLNKKLYFLNDIPEMIYTDELVALQPIVLHGDLKKII